MAGHNLMIAGAGSNVSTVQRNDKRFNNAARHYRTESYNSTSSISQRQSPKSIPNGKKGDGSEGFEMESELSFRITFRNIGAGLANLGNTCFLNSVLQCLTYTEPLAAYLQSGKHQTSCRAAGFCALCAIQKHVSRALQSNGKILVPKEIVSNLRCISRSFRKSRQEDAHEYMVNLLESMHKCCLPSGVPSESPSAYDKSLVHKIFGGRLRSQVKCMQCSFSSNKFDPFIDLSLEIVKADSLQKALAHFTAKEQLDGGDRQYQCQQCKQKVRAHKQLTIHKAPYVLTIHLKRFGSYLVGQKIDKKIHFGPTLDLKPFVTDPCDRDLKYTLYGVLVHAGWSTHSGHYYCFVRTSSGMWYSLDDNQVVQVSERKVLEQKAYMLFYYRDNRSFGSKKSDHKDNVTTLAMRSMSSSLKQSHEVTQSARMDRILENKASSVACAQRDSLNATLMHKNADRDCTSKIVSGRLALAEKPAPNKDPLLGLSSISSPLKDSLKGSSVMNREDKDCVAQQYSITKGSLLLGEYGSDRNCKEGADSDAGKDLLSLGANLPASGVHMSPKNDFDEIDSGAAQLDTCVRTEEQILPQLSSSPTIGENCQGLKDSPKPEPSVPAQHSASVPAKQNVISGKHIKRMKMKLPNYPMMKMQLSSKIFIATSLRVRKEKHKRNKECITRYFSKKMLMDVNGIPLDLRPSTSKSSQPYGNITTPQRKGKETQSKKNKKNKSNNLVLNSNGNFVTSISHEGNVKGVNGNCSLLADKSLNSGKLGSAENEWIDKGHNNAKYYRKKSMQNGLMGMLTRGLEETIVARLDEIKSNSMHMTDISCANNFASSYVSDEWDRKYDQGNRKRTGSFKKEFSGQNTVQEIVSMNKKAKRARFDQSSSGSRPFRI